MLKRRGFIGTSAAIAFAARPSQAQEASKLQVGVIGHTGRGNYGHGLDTVWLRLPQHSEIVSVADADAAGLRSAMQRLQVERGFSDYRELLSATKPDIVAVCQRYPDQHAEMILAAIENGARGIYCEKPFCRTPAEADSIKAACERQQVKLAVAHRNRYHPTLQAIDKIIASGEVGRILELRGRGKGDRRGGGEDLWVLGCHVFNLFHYFAGPAISCSAIIKKNGQKVSKADIAEGNEALGPIAGDEIHARFDHSSGITSYFDSVADDGTGNQAFGLQIIASAGVIDIKIDVEPLAHQISGNPFRVTLQGTPWVPITSAGLGQPEPIQGLADALSHHEIAARDLIESVVHNRQPLCNVHEAAMTIEMIHAVFSSHRYAGQAVSLPLANRTNQLLLLS